MGIFSFRISLSLKNKGEDRLEFSIPLRSRLVLVLFFALSWFVFVSTLVSADNSAGYIIPLVLICVTGLSALYEERWIFDKKRGLIESHFGLLFLPHKKSLPLHALARVELDAFLKRDIDEARSRVVEGRTSTSSRNPDRALLGGLLRSSRGRSTYRMIRLRIVDKQEKSYVLDSTRDQRVEEFRITGRKIADFCNIPFHEN